MLEGQELKRTDLALKSVNQGLAQKDFVMEPIEGWQERQQSLD